MIATADRKIAIIGAAKDMTVAGDLTFTNPNDAEDHALVLGAMDDFMLDENITTPVPILLWVLGVRKRTVCISQYHHHYRRNLAAGTLGTLNITKADFVVGNANSATRSG